MPTDQTTGANRHRRSNALIGAALLAPWLVLGGFAAHAAEGASAAPLSQSSTWAATASPVTAPTTTVAPAAAAVTASSISAGPAGSGQQTIGVSVLPGATSVSPAGAAGSSSGISAGPASSVQQTIGVSVLPGVMTVSPATEAVMLSQVGLLGQNAPVYRGDLSPVTVNDARGSLAGWHATISLQGVDGVSAAALAGVQLCASAPAPTMVAGNPADVVRGVTRSCAGVGKPVSVFFAAPGGGGGAYSDTASLTLALPGVTLPAQVTATLAVSVG